MTHTSLLTDLKLAEMLVEYKHSKNRLILLDYDGTLVNIQSHPKEVMPSEEVIDILKSLSSEPRNSLAIITGRSKEYISKWFGIINLFLYAEHGSFVKEPDKDWVSLYTGAQEWKASILPLFYTMAKQYKGALVEEKESSVVWHYRNMDQEKTFDALSELYHQLETLVTPEMNIVFLEGKKVLEVKQKGFDKGTASLEMLKRKDFQFILAIGDDLTDEDMFRVLPANAYSIKVGFGSTWARMNIDNPEEVLKLLEKLADQYKV